MYGDRLKSNAGRLALACMLGVVALTAGCEAVNHAFKTDMTRWLDPSKVIDAPPRLALNPILQTISMMDESHELVPNSTFPTDEDLRYSDVDYVIGPNDILDIGIMDLFADGLETVLRRQVANSGFVDLPLLEDRIKAEDLTQPELKKVISDAYVAANILREPMVSVTIAARRQNTYSILGAIAGPAIYSVTSKDMRLLEALAMARGVTQTNIQYIYVFRQTPPEREAKVEPTKITPESLPELPPEAPGGPEPAEQTEDAALQELEKVMGGPAKTKPAEPRPLPAHSVLPLLTETFSTSASGTGAEPPTEMRVYKWIYSDGRWIRVAQEAPVATQPSGEGAGPVRPAGERPIEKKSFEQMEAEADPFGWKKADKSRLTRIIAINLKKLNNGDPRMNIVIRDKDVIRIPTLEVGEFYVMGEVLRPGVYSLTGRRVTVKQALTAAGNLGALAWPQNSILVRRIGDDQEQTVPIDIEAIFRGEEPDFLLKPNDVLAIGTDIRATFFAVLRNAFRMTYGFGFIYDRNFADPYVPTLNSKRFTRW